MDAAHGYSCLPMIVITVQLVHSINALKISVFDCYNKHKAYKELKHNNDNVS